jgi:GntR family transcriptional regulator
VSLQHESSVPLYIQLKELLQKQIHSGEYAVGARLPSERELAAQYNVSRMTARQSLQALAQEGLISSRVGKGTFVSAPKINQELRALTSFSEDMEQRGLKPSSRVLKAEVRPADSEIASRLAVSVRSQVAVLQRVRLADDQPMAVETTYISYQLCPRLLERYDFSQVSLYEVLRRDYGWELVWADQIIETQLPDDNERTLLGITKKTPVLRFTRVTFNADDHPLEFVRSTYRGDRYRLRTILRYSEHQLR